jgi:GntR family transcriptional regulator/MocR family aminotransferase
MVIQLSGSGPLYRQVYRAIREAILQGRLRSGDRLPVSRGLARDLGISRNVVMIAYEQLIAEGYAFGQIGSGTYVAASVPDSMIAADRTSKRELRRTQPASVPLSQYARRLLSCPGSDAPVDVSAPPVQFDFAYYRASAQNFPHDLWRRLLVRHHRTLDLEYAPVQGDAALREEIAKYLRRSRAVDCEPGQILLVNGSQQALDLVSRVLIDPGNTVVLEEPHYQGAREIFRAAGAKLRFIPVDRSGLQVDRLPKPPRKVRLAYVTPSHQFPTGAVLPLDRRLALLSWAEKMGAYILEDDYDAEHRYEGRPLEAVQGLDRSGRVIYIGTFTRVLFPSLRLGYVVMPAPLRDALSRVKWIADRHTSSLQQAALAAFMREGHFDHYVRRFRAYSAARRAALLEAIEENFGDAVEVLGATAGMHVLVRFPAIPAGRTAVLIERAARAGVGVYSAAPYYGAKAHACCELMLGYGALTQAEIATGIRLLREAAN